MAESGNRPRISPMIPLRKVRPMHCKRMDSYPNDVSFFLPEQILNWKKVMICEFQSTSGSFQMETDAGPNAQDCRKKMATHMV